ncbi:hypothetical protein ACFQ1E_08295 [Sphingomonas canadensis]|uniref:Circumsporozoite protein n=1 Tax=Sphingomonas canadensis TaxID=1219257 RepID=A0ABW3H4F6_9SPHN|nr:hypothetical protein [Sphingomonas canadensis]MCW3836037.1 hypothetical protein [Sphingomonas canadensis]
MRAILSKAVAVSMIAGAGLLVTACGGETPAVNNTATVVDETNVSDEMVTNLDGATGNEVVSNVAAPVANAN